MAITKFTIDGFGQVELNNVAFRRDGRIEAQSKPGESLAKLDVENGMLLAVDGVKRTVELPKDAKLPIAFVYSTEHMYDERTPGLKNFKLNSASEDFYPRLGYLAVGDKFHTNCLSYDKASNDGTHFQDEEAVKTALKSFDSVPVYGGIDATLGRVLLTKTPAAAGPVLKVIEVSTMPDGQFGLKFQVLSV